MFDTKKFLNEADQLYVVFSHEEKGKLYIPFIGIDGRMEFLTTNELAVNAVKALKAKLKVNTYVNRIDGNENIRQFIRYLRLNGLNMVRINNGTPDMQDISLKDIDDYPETSLVDYFNRPIRNKLIRCKLYEKSLFELTDEEKKGPYGSQFAELAYTVRFNAFREMYNGILYVLSMDSKPAGGEYYTAAALKQCQEALKSQIAEKVGLNEASLLHGSNTNAKAIKKFPELYYVNQPGQTEKEKGFVCVFTDFESAVAGMNAIVEAGGKKGSVLAITAKEIMEKTMDYAGIVMDMNTINYMIVKKDYETIEKCGHYKEPIVVKLKGDKK